MKKYLLYTLLLLVVAAVACKPTNKPNQPAGEDKEAQRQKEVLQKCTDSVRAYVLRHADARNGTLDTLQITAMDSATEKMVYENYCRLLDDVKKASDKYVDALNKEIEAARKVHISLAENAIARLAIAKEKQKIADEDLEKCQKDAEAANGTDYNYRRITTFCVLSTPERKDTLRGPFFVDENFKLRLF